MFILYLMEEYLVGKLEKKEIQQTSAYQLHHSLLILTEPMVEEPIQHLRIYISPAIEEWIFHHKLLKILDGGDHKMLEVKRLTSYDIGPGIALAMEGIEDLALKDSTFDPIMFNFKIKNMFVTPGVNTFGLYSNTFLVGFFVFSEQQMIWSSMKKILFEFLYLKKEYRSDENIEYVVDLLEKKMIEEGYESVIVSNNDPFISEELLQKRNYKATTTVYEKINRY